MRILLFGTFDRLHPGHRFVLREAAKQGELTVVIARDTTVERLKGRSPVQNEEERRNAVAAELPEATVLLGDAVNFLKPVCGARPEKILLGYDQKLPPGIQMEDFPCPVSRLPAFEPDRYKSSRLRSSKR